MNTISSLPDDLLLKILSSSLSIKEVMATSLLSKRWRFLWKHVTKLSWVVMDHWKENELFFIYLRKAPLLQSFHLKVHHHRTKLDDYIDLVANLSVPEVRIESVYRSYTLPESLYNRSWNLQTLIFQRLSLEGVISCTELVPLRMRFLKTLHLLSVKFSNDESVETFLSTCPVLEDLVVRRTPYVNVMMFTINVPTLRSLSIHYSGEVTHESVGVRGFVINAPSLSYLNIRDCLSNALRFGHVPKLVKANVEVACDDDNFLGSLTSIQHLSLCSKASENPFGTSFLNLEHVELCTCSPVWWNLLNSILEEAPRLQVLKLKLKHYVRYSSSDPLDLWYQPCFIPKCLRSSLEIFERRHYKGTNQENKVAKYILANASCLRMAKFSSISTNKERLFKKLEYVARGSEACQLVFH